MDRIEDFKVKVLNTYDLIKYQDISVLRRKITRKVQEQCPYQLLTN
jgi:hypothetical protein